MTPQALDILRGTLGIYEDAITIKGKIVYRWHAPYRNSHYEMGFFMPEVRELILLDLLERVDSSASLDDPGFFRATPRGIVAAIPEGVTFPPGKKWGRRE